MEEGQEGGGIRNVSMCVYQYVHVCVSKDFSIEMYIYTYNMCMAFVMYVCVCIYKYVHVYVSEALIIDNYTYTYYMCLPRCQGT